MSDHDRLASARSELLSLQAGDGGWPYRRGASSAAEPTALAGLALAAHASGDDARAGDLLRAAADRLAAWQRPDGSVGVSSALPDPCWATPHAILLWKAAARHDDRLEAAARWLLQSKGRALSREEDPNRVAGHDTSLIGWPWVAGTHSWLEPTVMAVLALGVTGRAGHPRVEEGLRLIRDRAVASGGWNYGNKSVFGRNLRAQPGPTGQALLALAAGPRSDETERAIAYLLRTLPEVRAAVSLGWGLIGLRAWGVEPDGADDWLDEALAATAGRLDAPPRLACLLLAAGARTLTLFGRDGGMTSRRDDS
jgi:hypothetical protein